MEITKRNQKIMDRITKLSNEEVTQIKHYCIGELKHRELSRKKENYNFPFPAKLSPQSSAKRCFKWKKDIL